MCGIFGAIGDYEADKVKILCLLNENRGQHSTGIWNGKAVLKDKITATEFCIKYKNVWKESDILLGHTRYATTGAITKDNAHPFIINNIVGTHNGAIYNFHDKMAVNNIKFEVDSQIIFHVLNKGIDKLKELHGYWGLAWYDRRDRGKLWLSCNNGELHYVIDSANNTLYYSSDPNHLKAIGVKGNIVKVKHNTILKIDIKTLHITKIKMKFYHAPRIPWDYKQHFDMDEAPAYTGYTAQSIVNGTSFTGTCDFCYEPSVSLRNIDGQYLCPTCSSHYEHTLQVELELRSSFE